MDLKDQFSRNLKELRGKHNHTQKDLGEILHVDKMTVSGWETGRKEPSFEMLQKIAEAYDTSVSALLSTGGDSAFPTIARTQAEFVQCLCALAASPFVSSAYLEEETMKDDSGWEQVIGQGIIFEMHEIDKTGIEYRRNPIFLQRCTCGLAFSKAYKTGSVPDASFDTAIRAVTADIATKEAEEARMRQEIFKHTEDNQADATSDDELPF
ncbi:MAG: helix-turn-helix domain-containing protein [Candidatus Faecivicinus sp.]